MRKEEYGFSSLYEAPQGIERTKALMSQAVKAPDRFCKQHLAWCVWYEEYEVAAYLKNRINAPDFDPGDASHPHYSSLTPSPIKPV